MKHLAGLLSKMAFTHTCTHARISMHGEAASTQALGAGEGSTVEPHRLHSATATPFSTGTSLSRVALDKHTHSTTRVPSLETRHFSPGASGKDQCSHRTQAICHATLCVHELVGTL